MRQRHTKKTDGRKLEVKRETLRTLDRRVISDQDLVQVAGGTFWPRRSCACG